MKLETMQRVFGEKLTQTLLEKYQSIAPDGKPCGFHKLDSTRRILGGQDYPFIEEYLQTLFYKADPEENDPLVVKKASHLLYCFCMDVEQNGTNARVQAIFKNIMDKELLEESFSNLPETGKVILYHSMNYGARREVKTLIHDYFRDVVEQPTTTEEVIAKYLSPDCTIVAPNGEVRTYADVVERCKNGHVPSKITFGRFIIDGDEATVTYKIDAQAEQAQRAAVFKIKAGRIVRVELYSRGD